MIYISLTTVPIRISTWNQFQKNINSLLNQNTTQDYQVILNIPYFYKNNNNEEYTIPEELKQLASKNSKLIINRVNNDSGPIVKITGVLEVSKDPNDILIVCDDDHIYHEDMLEYHLYGLNNFQKYI
jgi:predicted ferric reductase